MEEMDRFAICLSFFLSNGAIAPYWARASRSHSDTPHSVRLLLTCDQSDAETLTTHNTYKIQTSIPPSGFEPAIPASEQRQTKASDLTATGIGVAIFNAAKY